MSASDAFYVPFFGLHCGSCLLLPFIDRSVHQPKPSFFSYASLSLARLSSSSLLHLCALQAPLLHPLAFVAGFIGAPGVLVETLGLIVFPAAVSSRSFVTVVRPQNVYGSEWRNPFLVLNAIINDD